MTVRVIIPPEPIVEPADIAGSLADDAKVAGKIAAATRTIDGPSGWLGVSLGKQTLELVGDCWRDRCYRLPYGPIIAPVSVKYLDAAGDQQTVDPSLYTVTGNLLWFRPAFTTPAVGCFPHPIRIRYEAGYNDVPVEDGGTGPVPEEAKQAVIVMTQDLMRQAAENTGLRSETVEGVGATTYVDTDRVSAMATKTAEWLLAGLRVYSL